MTLFVIRVMLVFCSPLLLQLIIGHVEDSKVTVTQALTVGLVAMNTRGG